MTTVVNLYAGPGAGKSTVASGVFSKLKLQGIPCELITEFAKDLTYEKRHNTLENQVYVFAKQYHRLYKVLDQGLMFLISDSPLLLSLAYATEYKDELGALVRAVHDSFTSFNVFVRRTKPYHTYGRSQTAQEARDLDKTIEGLTSFDFEITGDDKGIEDLYEELARRAYLETKGRCAI